MIDFILGAGLAVLLARGWIRGLVREAIGLAVILVGAFLAFRLAGPMGAVVSAMSGAGEDAARIAGGIIVFLLVSVGGAVVSWLMHKGVAALPGLTTANRAGGAAFSGVAGLLAATVVASVLALLPLPAAAAEALDGSSLVGFMTEPDGIPQKTLGFISLDRVLTSALELQKSTGEHRLVAPARGTIDIPPAGGGEIAARPNGADKVADLINESRVGAGADPLARSQGLDDIALELARTLYRTGRLSHNDGDRGLRSRLADAGIPVVVSGEAIALAPSPRSAVEAVLEDDAAGTVVVGRDYRRIGVAAVRGPLGLLVVAMLVG